MRFGFDPRRRRTALRLAAPLFAAGLCLAVPLSRADAQATGTITGTVTGEAGQALGSAQVNLVGTTLGTIPAAVPYLQADPVLRARWQRALRHEKALKVGVVWAGNPLHKGDRFRSIVPDAVLPRLVIPGVQLYSLQKGARPAGRALLTSLGSNLVDLAPVLGSFADTAAAVDTLDLVISVDTSVAHLAGGLGRPVWVLLPYALDWRWLREREDSPWYPTMRLFRQDKPQAWDGVIARVAAELARVAAGETARLWPPSAEAAQAPALSDTGLA